MKIIRLRTLRFHKVMKNSYNTFETFNYFSQRDSPTMLRSFDTFTRQRSSDWTVQEGSMGPLLFKCFSNPSEPCGETWKRRCVRVGETIAATIQKVIQQYKGHSASQSPQTGWGIRRIVAPQDAGLVDSRIRVRRAASEFRFFEVKVTTSFKYRWDLEQVL